MNKRIFAICLLLPLFASSLCLAQPRPIAKMPAPVKPYLMAQMGNGGNVKSVAYSRDGRYVLVGGNNIACLWDAATGAEIRLFTGHSDRVTSVAFSPNGRFVLTGSADNTARLWETATGKEIRQFKGHTQWVNSAIFSDDGRFVLTASGDYTACLWETATGKEVRRYRGHSGYVTSAVFSSDDRYVLTGAADNTVRLWEKATGKEVRQYVGHSSWLNSVAFSPDGRFVLTGSNDKTARLWETATGKEIRQFQGDTGPIQSVAFSPDGKFALTGNSDAAAHLWETATGKEVRKYMQQPGVIYSDVISSVVFSADGRFVLTGSEDNIARLFETATGKEVRQYRGHSDVIDSVAFSPDGRFVLTGGRDSTARLWETATGKEVQQYKGHLYGITSVAFSPDGQFVLTGGVDYTTRMWETETGKEVRRFQGPMNHVLSVAFSPDGQFVLTGSTDHTAHLWETTTGKELRQFQGHMSRVWRVAFSPDGRFVLTGSWDWTARLWETATGKEVHQYRGHSDWVMSVAFSPDGRFVLTGSRDKTACLWDAATGKVVQEFKGHSRAVLAVAFSADGRYVLTGSADNTTRLWETATGKEVQQYKGHTGDVQSVAFSTDGRYVLTGSTDGTTRLWETATGKELCRLMSFDDGSWAVADNEGRYDASDPDRLEGLYWVVGNEPIALRQLKERYYEPNLLAKIMAGQRLRDVQAFDNVKLQPEVVTEPLNGTRLTVHLTERGGGFGKVQVFVNDTLYREVMPPAASYPAKRTVTLDIAEAPTLRPGKENQVRVVAYNAEGWLPSRGIELACKPQGEAIKERHLFAIVCGISDYAAPELHLGFPAKDAADFADALRRGAKNFFGADRVFVTLLASSGPSGTLPVTKDNLRQAFEAVRKQARPEDVLVVYLAGHGVALPIENSLYCYLTQDANSTDTAKLAADQTLRERTAVTSSELAEWIGATKASYRVMVLDTCAAGAAEKSLALADKRAPDGDQIRAMELFKDRTGFHVLMGCAADRASYEASRYRQGVLTYALLQGMKGAALDADAFVNVQKLFNYAVDTVPKLAGSIGGVQNPLYRAPNTGGIVVGQLTPDDRKAITLSDALPQLLRPKLSNKATGDDDLDLEKRLRQRLRDACDVVPRGNPAPPPLNAVYYDDTDEFPGAIRAVGQYEERADGTVVLTLTLRRDKQPLGPPLTLEGRKDDPAGLIAKLASAIANGIAGKQP